MARLVLPSAYAKQPQVPVQINRRNPCAAGLGAFWNFGVSNYNQVDGKRPLLQGVLGTDYKTAFTQYGRSLNLPSANLDRIQLGVAGTIESPGANDFSVACQLTPRTNLNGYSAIGRWDTGSIPENDEWLLGAGLGLVDTTVDFVVSVGTVYYSATITGSSWANDETYTLFGRRKGTTIYIDRYTHSTGKMESASFTDAAITTINTVAARHTKLGELDTNGVHNVLGDWYWAGIWNRYVPDSVVQEMFRNPWQIYSLPRKLWVRNANTLVASKGTFTLTGNATGLKAARQLVAANRAFTLAGINNVLTKGAGGTLIAGTGAFALSGKSVNFFIGKAPALKPRQTGNYGRLRSVNSPTYLRGTPVLSKAALLAIPGAFMLNGPTTSLKKASVLSCTVGTFALSGIAAIVAKGKSMPAATGAFALTGNPANLATNISPVLVTGVFNLTGRTAALKKDSKLSCATGSFTLSGVAANFAVHHVNVLTAAKGTFLLVAPNTNLNYQQVGFTGGGKSGYMLVRRRRRP